MNTDELSDRVRALEALNRTLIRYLLRNSALEPEDLESMMDSLVDQATGDEAATYHAERLKVAIEGETGSDESRERNRRWLHAQRKTLYGYDGPVL